MGWRLEGTYFESCSCNTPCPCTTSLDLGADLDYCRALLAFNIRAGEVEGTDMGGRRVALLVDTPKVMTEGNWDVALFIDDEASDEQMEKLGQVFSGQLGGPPEALGPLIGQVKGVERAPMEVSEEGHVHSLRIGDSVDIEVEDIVPFGVENGEPARLTGIFHPAGDTLTIAKARRARVNAFGIEYEGHSAFSLDTWAWSA